VGGKSRFPFIDHFRGLIIALMALDHASTYFNTLWISFDPLDPLFPGLAQFLIRYSSYLCAPGFLILTGAMIWLAYQNRRKAGLSEWQAKWYFIKRGLFLVLLQITWVNSSWGGFASFRPAHIGIIACIGLSMCLLALFVNARWGIRLAIGLGVLIVHPFLLKIPYDPKNPWQEALMQTFIDAGDFNKYPVLPWFALATLGSVIGVGWLKDWTTTRRRVGWTLVIAAASFAVAIALRMGRGYGNLLPFDRLGTISFFLDPKYPPSLFHNLWFFGAVISTAAVLDLIGRAVPALLKPLAIYGRVALFFYAMHIAILGVVSKRLGLYYLQLDVGGTLLGWVALLLVMIPICVWFGRIKQRSDNWIIQMI